MQTFIYIEQTDEKVDPVVKQIAAKLKGMPDDARGPVTGITLGRLGEKSEGLSGLFDNVVEVSVPEGNDYNMEMIGNILADIVGSAPQGILFLGFTHQGMELGPAVSHRLGLPLVTACTDFALLGGKASVKRLTHSGKVSVDFEVDVSGGAVFSVQKGALKVETDGIRASSPPAITSVPWKEEWAAKKSRIVQIIKEAVAEGEDIGKARILVSVGRGLGTPDNLPPFRELAALLGGMLSCSRPVVDLGWLPAHHQVGLSGRTVSPIVYIALAISGQNNHVVAMETSKIIFAVNKDPQAPVFQVAHYGVIDDIHEFVPEMIARLKKGEG